MSASRRAWEWFEVACRQHWLPLLLLVIPIGFVVWSTELEIGVLLLALPVAAFVVGFALRPRHVWLVWLGAVVIQWIAMGVLGKYADPEDESALSLVLEAFAWMAMGVLLPIWLGRTIRNILEQDRPAGATPAGPAS
jgi:hypothetical protein